MRVNGSVATHIDASVSEGQLVEIMIPEIKDIDNFPENIPLNIVYEDDYLIVVNKPVGMVVHPAPGSPNKTLVTHCSIIVEILCLGWVAVKGLALCIELIKIQAAY